MIDAEMEDAAPSIPKRAPCSWQDLEGVTKTLAPLGIPIGETQPGDWLEEHVELGQTFLQYVGSRPTKATEERNKIYIMPLGEFNQSEHRIVECVSEFLAAFYGLPVIVQDTVGLAKIDCEKMRGQQILSSYLLNKLKKSLPSDAATHLCLTSSDLWPGKGWNFVFGQANLRDRVGVWSLYRFGSQFRKCLLRTLAIAVHETGHMFGMRHCTSHSCGMCGTNSLYESDRRPLHFCPECTPKVALATGVDLETRANKLQSLCEQWELKEEARYYARSAELLSKQHDTNRHQPLAF